MNQTRATSLAELDDFDLRPAVPPPEPLSNLFLHRSEVHGNRIATYSKRDSRWLGTTWYEARQAVEEVALGLVELGVQRGDRIAIISQTRREWAQADMAILCMGAITVGVYPTLTGPQTRELLAHAGVCVVFAEDRAQRVKIQEATADFPEPLEIVTLETRAEGPHVRTLDTLRRMGARRRLRQPEEFGRRVRENKSSDVATYVYTSGTTGEPKAVMLTHANFHYVIHATQLIVQNKGERSLIFLPLAHALQRCVSYLALIEDVEAYYAESLERVPDNLVEVQPSCFALVPRVLEKIHARILATGRQLGGTRAKIFDKALSALSDCGAILRDGREPGPAVRAKARAGRAIVGRRVQQRLGGRVKYIGCGSAPLSRDVHAFFEDIGIPILEGWGLTETSAPVCLNTLSMRRIGSVGRPIPGTSVKVAEDGEILVRGPGVFAGYYRNETATREAFDAEGWFKTGDIGQMSRDGFLQITDRKKDLIITSGGKNVAPQPIESALTRDPWIGQAVVIGDRRPYLTALIGVDTEARILLSEKYGLAPGQSGPELAAIPELRQRIERQVSEVNARLPGFEQIKQWDLLPAELSIESGELTPTLKVKRRVVQERYADRIAALYER